MFDNDFGWWGQIIVVFTMFMGACVMINILSEIPDQHELIETGKHFKNECKLIEVNIDNGFLSDNTNRLNCDGVINNVSTPEYNAAVSAYESSLSK